MSDKKNENTPAQANASNPFVTPDYEERQDARRDRLQIRAIKKREESHQAYKRSHQLIEHIPMGQPILVGHHSERAHRNALDKSWNALGKSVALDEYAKDLEQRADSVGEGGIASNDPEVLTKLREKLDELIKAQETMKAANKALRKGDDQALADLGFTALQIVELKTPNCFKQVGFPDYSLKNNNANIRRVRQRIASIEALHQSEPFSFNNDHFSINVEDGRVRVIFHDGKPSDEVRALVKSHGFKWSRYATAWVRKATPNAMHAAERLCDALKAVETIY